ncbi:MAG: hypothetical protein ACUVTD_00370 [Nitrososphaerales archaeon]
MSLTEAFLLIILTFIIFVIFIAIFIYLMHSVFRWGKVRWGFGFFPPGIVLWKKSVEEELSELRSYEMWLKSELDRIRREIEEREKHKS